MQYDIIEDELENIFIDKLKLIYNKNNYSEVFLIFFVKSYIYKIFNILNNKKSIKTMKKINEEDILNFLLKELNLPEEKILYYKNIPIYKKTYSNNNSIMNIIDNWIFRYETEFNLSYDILLKYKKEIDRMFRYEKKSSQYYMYRYCYELLYLLLLDFNCINNINKKIDNLQYPINFNFLNFSFEEECTIYNDLYKKENNIFVESDLEKYIINLGYLDNIKILGHQIKTTNGRIDLLGKRDNKYVVIELKIKKEPRDVIYQVNLYKEDLKNIYGDFDIVIISPPLKESIYTQLKKLNTELYYFNKKDIDIDNYEITFEKQF